MKLDLEEGTAEIDLEGAAELLQFAVNDPLMSKFTKGKSDGGKKEKKEKIQQFYTENDEAKYQRKKMLASGMMDLALLSANSNQLRHILESPKHPFYFTRLMFISSSLFFQVLVLVFIVINTNYSIPKAGEKVSKMATFLNTSITGGILIISVINGFASAFGGAILN